MIILLLVAICLCNWFAFHLGEWLMSIAGYTANWRWLYEIGSSFHQQDFLPIMFLMVPFIIIGTPIWMRLPE